MLQNVDFLIVHLRFMLDFHRNSRCRMEISALFSFSSVEYVLLLFFNGSAFIYIFILAKPENAAEAVMLLNLIYV